MQFLLAIDTAANTLDLAVLAAVALGRYFGSFLLLLLIKRYLVKTLVNL